MALKSVTIKNLSASCNPAMMEAVSRALAEREWARAALVAEAKEIAEERRRRLASIKDPALRRSAAL